MDEGYSKKRFIELSRMSYEKGVYMFTPFLSLADLSDFHDSIKELYPSGYKIFGGYDGAERCMIAFGSQEALGYEQEFPIACVRIAPLNAKFAQKLTHRDYLGSLMNMGLERAVFGDIVMDGQEAFVFTEERIAEDVCRNLTRVKHTSVMTDVITEFDLIPKPHLVEKTLQAKSERIDGIVAKVYNLSRNQSAELFVAGNIFLNGRQMSNESHILHAGDLISVRGHGRFFYRGAIGSTRKGNLNIRIEVFEG